MANQGVGTDADGAYGTQCVDLPNSISINFFGKALWGNAIDLLNSAAGLGYTVYDAIGVNPRAGPSSSWIHNICMVIPRSLQVL